MHIILSDETGERTEGILLAASPGSLRIVAHKLQDTMELCLVDGRWTTESGKVFYIESLISDGEIGFHEPFAPLTRRACN